MLQIPKPKLLNRFAAGAGGAAGLIGRSPTTTAVTRYIGLPDLSGDVFIAQVRHTEATARPRLAMSSRRLAVLIVPLRCRPKTIARPSCRGHRCGNHAVEHSVNRESSCGVMLSLKFPAARSAARDRSAQNEKPAIPYGVRVSKFWCARRDSNPCFRLRRPA